MNSPTGRPESKNPPIQNLPINTPEGREIREVFTVNGLTLSQQERRASSLWWNQLSRSDKLRYTNTYFHNWTMEMVENSTSAVLRVWKGEGNKL